MSEEEKILNVFENTGDYGEYYLGDYSNEDIAKFIRNILQENKQLKDQLKQKVEVIDGISQILNKHRFEENDDYYDYFEQGICITSWDDDYDRLNELLQKCKGDNND